MSSDCRRRRGFSLLELLAVVTIIGIIAIVVVPRISTSRHDALRSVAQQCLNEYRRAIERYYFDTGTFPPDLATVHSNDKYLAQDSAMQSRNLMLYQAGYNVDYRPATGQLDMLFNGLPID